MGFLNKFFGVFTKTVARLLTEELKKTGKINEDEVIKPVLTNNYTVVEEKNKIIGDVNIYAFYIWNDDGRFEWIGNFSLKTGGLLCPCGQIAVGGDYSEEFSVASKKAGDGK